MLYMGLKLLNSGEVPIGRQGSVVVRGGPDDLIED